MWKIQRAYIVIMYVLNMIKNQELKLMGEGGARYLRFENVNISFCDNLKCTQYGCQS